MKFWINLAMIILVFVFGFALSSCSSFQLSNVEFIFKDINEYGVNDEFELSRDSLIIGKSLDITTLSFLSNNETVAEVDNNIVKCKNVGQAEIFAHIKSYNGSVLGTSYILNVKKDAIKLSSFSVKTGSISMLKGNSVFAQSYMEFTPANYIYPVILTSSNEEIISIDNSEIIALKEGEASVFFSVLDYLTKEQKVEELVIEVAGNSYEVKNLINGKIIFSTLSNGEITHNFHSNFITEFSFRTDSELLELSFDGTFKIGEQSGSGYIIINYILMGGISVISYDFEITEPPKNVSIQEEDYYFTDSAYTVSIEGENLSANNFIFSEDIEIIEDKKNTNCIELIFKFLNKEISHFSFSYKGNFSYTFEEVIIFEKNIKLYDNNDIIIDFLYEEQSIKESEIVLYLLNKNFENISHQYYAEIAVFIDDNYCTDYQVEPNDYLIFENNKLKTLDAEGECEITILIADYNFTQKFKVEKLLVREFELEYESILYLNATDDSNESLVVIKYDNDYAYNVGEVKFINLSADVISIKDYVITITAMNNEKSATFKVKCGEIEETVTIALGYYITELKLLIDSEEWIKENPLQLNMNDKKDVIVSFEIRSGDILIVNIINSYIENQAVITSNPPQFSDIQLLKAISCGQTIIRYEITGNYSGLTNFNLAVIVS